ncbi:MAG: diaminopimelate decarboxylase [Patescibacteria group bacterium]
MKKGREVLNRAALSYGTPLYVYEQQAIEAQCQKLKRHFPNVAFHYAMKANSNPEILRLIRKQGIGAEAVSLGEIALAKHAGFKANDTSFTCASLMETELTTAAASGARVHLDSLTQLEAWGRRALGREVSLRLNRGIGAGHHAHVITGGPHSKFGIALNDIPEAQRIADTYGLTITGIQQHIGSNVLDAGVFLKSVRVLLQTAKRFSDIAHIDFGGGLGIPYAPGESQLDLKRVAKEFKILTGAFKKSLGRDVSFAMEPGRFIVAESGSLLVSVVDQKETSAHQFVGVNSGFNQLIRHAMYGSYHPIENLSRTRGPKTPITAAGNVCESGDLFAVDRVMVRPELGDVLAIRNAGAYGFSMASNFNMHALPREVLVSGAGRLKDISFNPSEYAR